MKTTTILSAASSMTDGRATPVPCKDPDVLVFHRPEHMTDEQWRQVVAGMRQRVAEEFGR